MRKRASLYLRHIKDAIILIQDFTSETPSYSEFSGDPLIQNSVMYQVIIIGEAVTRLPTNLTNLTPNIPWKEIRYMRNKLVHDYFSVDTQILWEVITKDLPELEKAIDKLLDISLVTEMKG